MAKKEEKMCEVIPVKKEISSSFIVLDASKFKDSLKNEMALLALDRRELRNLRMSGTTVTDHLEDGRWQMNESFKETQLYRILSTRSLREQYRGRLLDMQALLKYKDETYQLHSIPSPNENKPTGGTWSYYYGGYEPDGSNVRYETQPKLLEPYKTPIPVKYAIRTEKETTQAARDETIAYFIPKVEKMLQIVKFLDRALSNVTDDYDDEENVIFEKIKDVLCNKSPFYYKYLCNAENGVAYSPVETINEGNRRMSIHPRTHWLKQDMGKLSSGFPFLATQTQKNDQYKTHYWPRNAMVGIVSSFIGQENFIMLCSSEEMVSRTLYRCVAVYMDLLGNIGIGQVVADPVSFIKNDNSKESLRSLTERQAMQVCFSSFVPVKYENEITPSGSIEIPKTPQAAEVSFAKRISINARAVLKDLPSGITISDKYVIDPQSGTTIPLISEQKALYLKDALKREYAMNMALPQVEEVSRQMPLITEVNEQEEDDGTKMIEEKE